MKRLVVAGLERCFQLSRVYRNGEAGPLHNPEFTMLEWYRAHASYTDILEDTQDLVLHLAHAAGVGLKLVWQGHEIDLAPPWERITVADSMARYAGIDINETDDVDSLKRAAQRAGVKVPEGTPWDEIFFRILMEKVEPHLGYKSPTFLIDYPPRLAALATVRGDARPVAERFELYIAGIELANAFTELSSPIEQRKRFEDEKKQRRELGAPVFEADSDYLYALEMGLPPTGGIAVGIDRLMMVLLDTKDISGVMAFPFTA